MRGFRTCRLLDELKETATPVFADLDDDKRAEIDEAIDMLTSNLEKIAEHGQRADGRSRPLRIAFKL